MHIEELKIPGCYQITPKIFEDNRGIFVKTFHAETLAHYGLNIELKEEFYSISKRNVLRGLHFQKQPSAHSKIVYCAKGSVLDFFVDIRKGSPTYGQSLSIELNEQNGVILFLPVGIAHGFLSLQDESLMIYKTDHSYDPTSDDGVSYKSCNIKLPVESEHLIISERDLNFVNLCNIESDFIYE